VSKSIIRPGSPADVPAVVSLMEAAGLRPNLAPPDLQWKYWRERIDFPGSRSFVMVRDGKLLAHAAVVPGSYQHNGRTVRTRHVIDWAARPDAAGAGVSLMKYLAQDTDALLAIGGSAQTLELLPLLGYRQCGAVTGFVRPLHPLRLLGPSAHPAWRVPPRVLRSALWKLQAPRLDLDGWQANRLTAEALTRLAPVLPTGRDGFAVLERNPDLFRYTLECPIAAMSLFVVQQAGEMRGYFLLSFAMRQVRLADCWLNSFDPADWRVLIQLAVRESSRYSEAAELVAWGSDSQFSQCLLACGFRARSEFPVQLLASRDNFPLPASLRVQMLDNDTAYRHTGRAEFWA
jgi:Acetyltransferase (GNAT) domain